jgi:hypothetical protein
MNVINTRSAGGPKTEWRLDVVIVDGLRAQCPGGHGAQDGKEQSRGFNGARGRSFEDYHY